MPKTLGGWIGFAFKATGALVAAAPMIEGVYAHTGLPGSMDNQIQRIPHEVLYNYTGYNTDQGAFVPSQLAVGIASVAGGLSIAFIGKLISKHFR